MRLSFLVGMSAGIVLFLLSSCSSMPRASVEDESLLVIATDLEDPLQMLTLETADGERRLSFSDEGLILLNLEAGEVRVGGESPLTVAAGTVMLYPKVFSAAKEPRETTPADQRRVMTGLTNYVGFESWFGREYLNFGPFRPKQYLSGEYFSLGINSEPQGARILIDNVVWGETPQTMELNAGKYLIEIAAPGYRSYKRIITLDQATILDPGLEAIQTETAERSDRFDIMIAPIRSMSAGEDPYGDVIASTMLVNFGSDPRLSASLAAASGTVSDYPDFAPAEEAGADLLVAGNYSLDGDTLYLEAVLYETTTRRIKYAKTYVSEAGFAVFDSIDEVARSFASAVSRTLPEPGEPIVEKEAAVTDELVSYEKSIYREQMIASRLERRNLVSAKIAVGGLSDQQEIGNTGEYVYSGGGDAPINVVRLDYQRVLTQYTSLSSALTVILQGVDADTTIEGPSIVPSFGLFLGPEFAFRTITSDVYFTPSLLLGFQPSYTVTTVADYEMPNRFYTGLELDVGYRYFFFGRRDDRPLFLNIGMFFDMIEVGFSSGGDFGIVPLRGGLYLGGGSAL